MKKKLTKFKDKIIKNLKRIKEEKMISNYFKDNRLFLVYVLVCVLNSTLLRIFTMPTMENYLSFKPIVALVLFRTFLKERKDMFIYSYGLLSLRQFVQLTLLIIHSIHHLQVYLCYLLPNILVK